GHRGAGAQDDPALFTYHELHGHTEDHAGTNPAFLRTLQGSRTRQVGEGRELGRCGRSQEIDRRSNRARTVKKTNLGPQACDGPDHCVDRGIPFKATVAHECPPHEEAERAAALHALADNYDRRVSDCWLAGKGKAAEVLNGVVRTLAPR